MTSVISDRGLSKIHISFDRRDATPRGEGCANYTIFFFPNAFEFSLMAYAIAVMQFTGSSI